MPRHALAATVASLLALAPLFLGTGPLAGPLGVPLAGSGDEIGQYVWVRTLAETGSVLANPRLGLPDGQLLADFPQAALAPLQVGLVRLILLGAPPQQAVNLYLALTFPLVALLAYPAFVVGGLRPRWALVGAVLFATTPYHFGRGAGHLFHSGYFGIPWLAVTCGWLLRGAVGGPTGWRGLAAAAGLGCLLGGVEPYYSAFALALLPPCAALGAARFGGRPLRRGLVLVGAVLGVVGAAWWPVIQELERWGANPAPLARAHAESETYGLKLTSLLVPAQGHRNRWMDGLARRYQAAPLTYENRWNSAGVLGSLGILGLLAALLVGGHGAARQRARGRLLVLVLLLGTVGGLGSTLALAGLTVVRAWNRLAVLATWLGLAGLLTAVQARSEALGAGFGRLLAGAVLAFGLWDQVPGEPLARSQAVHAAWDLEARGWRELERSRPELRRLFVVPHRSNPSESASRYHDWWDQQRPYLHTEEMAFSAGSFGGRRGERRVAALSRLPLEPLLHRLASEGWHALMLDAGADPGPAEAWAAALEARLPGTQLGRYRVHSLVGCEAACRPETEGVYLRGGIGVTGGVGTGEELALLGAQGELLLLHGGDDARLARLTLRARSVSGAAGWLAVSLAGREPARLELSGDGTASREIEVEVPPEGLTVGLETSLEPALEEDRLPEHGRRVSLAGSEVGPAQATPRVRELQ